MKTKGCISVISMIKPTAFYYSESEKTKLNWFCYQLSGNIYFDINKNLGKRLNKYKIDECAIAEFSIYLSMNVKDIILQKLSGKIEKICFSYEMIEPYFPNLNDKLINKMLDAILRAWDELLSFCEECPNRCISEKDAYCTLFDDVDYF